MISELPQFSSSDAMIESQNNKIFYHINLSWPEDPDVSLNELTFIFEPLNQFSDTLEINLDYDKTLQKKLPEIIQTFSANNLIFVAYMAGRFLSEEAVNLKNTSIPAAQTTAFTKAFNRSFDYETTLAWFNNIDADEARSISDDKKKTEDPQLIAVRKAISKSLLGQYDRPRMKGSPPELVIYKKGSNITYKVNQLSDGYRAMLALVMDLARRMALVYHDDNSFNEKTILHAPSIVLIDEIEQHLHPSWQQKVLLNLMEIFPFTQFIVTTHSPQVLSSIPAKNIRILGEGKAFTVNEQTEGAESSRLLKQVLGVNLRPPFLDIVSSLTKYTELVYQEKWNTPEALELRKKLLEHFSDDEPELAELELHIENSKWERGL